MQPLRKKHLRTSGGGERRAIVGGLLLLTLSAAGAANAQSCTNATEAYEQTQSGIHVPKGCHSMQVKMWGAGGNSGCGRVPLSGCHPIGYSTFAVGDGGGGGAIVANIPVDPDSETDVFSVVIPDAPDANDVFAGGGITELRRGPVEGDLLLSAGAGGAGGANVAGGACFPQGLVEIGHGGAGGLVGQEGHRATYLEKEDETGVLQCQDNSVNVATLWGGKGGSPAACGAGGSGQGTSEGHPDGNAGTPCSDGSARRHAGYGGKGYTGGGGGGARVFGEHGGESITGAGGGGGANFAAPGIVAAMYSGTWRTPGNPNDPDRGSADAFLRKAGDGGLYDNGSFKGIGRKGRIHIRWSADAVLPPPAPPPSLGDLTHGSLMTRAYSGATAAEHLYRIVQGRYSSYEVRVDAISGQVNPPANPLLVRRLQVGGAVAQNAMPVELGRGFTLRWRNDSAVAVEGELIQIARDTSPGSTAGTEGTYRVRAYETTYYVSRFNNTGTNSFTTTATCLDPLVATAIQCTTLRIFNGGASAVSGKIHFWDSDGVFLRSESFGLAANASAAINTWNIQGVADKKGSITIANDASYAMLSGQAEILEAKTQSSFVSPMVPRAR